MRLARCEVARLGEEVLVLAAEREGDRRTLRRQQELLDTLASQRGQQD